MDWNYLDPFQDFHLKFHSETAMVALTNYLALRKKNRKNNCVNPPDHMEALVLKVYRFLLDQPMACGLVSLTYNKVNITP